MLVKNITTGQTYEIPSAVYNAMEAITKGKFQVINEIDAENIQVQTTESNLTEEQKEIKKIKKTKTKKENL